MADGSNLPVILIEVVLIFGGTLAFGWWQLRSVKRDRERMRAAKAQDEPRDETPTAAPTAARAVSNDTAPPPVPPPR